jgi:5'-3' exonuclease
LFSSAQRIDRQLRKKEILERIGRARIGDAVAKANASRFENPTLSMIDKDGIDEDSEASEVEELVPHNTRNQIAESAGVSHTKTTSP